MPHSTRSFPSRRTMTSVFPMPFWSESTQVSGPITGIAASTAASVW